MVQHTPYVPSREWSCHREPRNCIFLLITLGLLTNANSKQSFFINVANIFYSMCNFEDTVQEIKL